MDGEQEKNVRLFCSATLAIVIMLVTYFGMLYRPRRLPIPREPSATGDLYGNTHMNHILNGSSTTCIDYLRMRKRTFFRLAEIMRVSTT